jgi:NAD(P)-dependent dehydrogenase (short-subunit alcohol dehydrogenase family)
MLVRSRRSRHRPIAAPVLAAVVGLLAVVATGPSSAEETGTASEGADSQNKTVLITGANRGLGYEFARQYAADGWHVIGTARRPSQAVELAALGVQVVELDVASAASVARLAGELEGQSIDLLINNAGIFPRSNTLEETDFDDVASTLAVNTIGPMRVTRALLPNLRRGSGKQIVSISSGLGSITDNDGGRFYGYRESKAGLNMFTRSLAAELDDEGFTCIVISPGWVQTDMGGPNASLTPEQSIRGMREVIAGLEPSDTGAFYNHDGSRLPW